MRRHETAEGVDLALIFREGHVVRWQRHLLLFGPLVRGWVVFVGEALGLPHRRETGEDIHLAARANAEHLLGRIGSLVARRVVELIRATVGEDGEVGPNLRRLRFEEQMIVGRDE